MFGEGGILALTPSPLKWPLKPLESTFNGEGVGPEIPPSPHIAYQQVAGNIPLEGYAQIYSVAVLTSQPTGIPLTPRTSHEAALLITNVPEDDTPSTQKPVVSKLGLVVNNALI